MACRTFDHGLASVGGVAELKPTTLGPKQSSACATVSPGPGCTAFLRKPNACISQSTAARASVYRKAGKMLGIGWSGMVRKIGKARLLAQEREPDRSCRPVTLLRDNKLCNAVVLRRFVVLLIHLFAENQDDNVSVLLEGSRFAQI